MGNSLKLKRDLFELIHVSHAINSEHNLEKLLRLIVTSAVDITHSDAASLYLKNGSKLRFVITKNKTLESRMGKENFEASLKSFDVPISRESISGFVADTGKTLNIKNVHKIKDKPYSFNKQFDKKNNYKTKSMLTVPLLNREDDIVGILQLINKLDKNNDVKTYHQYDEDIAISLGAQAAISIENVRLTEQLKKAHYDSIMTLSAANEFRDNETGLHVKRVSLYSELLARTIGENEETVDLIKFASPLHDIGKIGIPDHILKKPGRLTNEEFQIMKTHTSIGAKMLGDPDFPAMMLAKEIALTHHERWDGQGYPNGISGKSIPLAGRITAIADVFDALSNKRVYKPAFPIEKTFEIIGEEAGTHFDPELVKAFLSAKDEVVHIFATLGESEED